MTRKREPLTRARVLEAALTIVDTEGLVALSMRHLASTVGVEAMSLYNHVGDKRDLLNGIVDLVLARIEPPDMSASWRQRLEGIALGLYGALVAHPPLAQILASEQGRPNDLRVLQGMDAIVAALAEAGLTARQQVSAYRGLIAMCFGFVLAHTQGFNMTRDRAQAAWESAGVGEWDPATLPNLARLGPEFLKTQVDDDFRFMLTAYLESLSAMKATRPTKAPPPKPARARRRG